MYTVQDEQYEKKNRKTKMIKLVRLNHIIFDFQNYSCGVFISQL